MSPRPALTAKQHQMMDLVARVRDIVERHGLGTSADLAHICRLVLPHTVDPRLAELTRRAREAERRADVAEAEVRRLRELHRPKLAEARHGQEWSPPELPPALEVEVSPRTALALTEMCAGGTITDVAEHMGLSYSSAVNLLNKAAHIVGAQDRAQAVALTSNGAVRVRVRDRRKDAAA